MIAYLAKALRAHIGAGRALYALTVCGAALGVAAVLCIQIINHNALAAFAGGIAAVSGDADLTIEARGPALSESVLPVVISTPGVASARPLVRIDAALQPGASAFLELYGVDMTAPSRLPLLQGADIPALADILTQPGWVGVSRALAEEQGWSLGSRFAVAGGARHIELVVGAIVDTQRSFPQASRRLAVMDIAQAQHWFGRAGELDQIDVQARAGADLEALSADLSTRLGEAAAVLRPAQREEQTAQLLAAFRLNLTALSLISLLVGLFVIHASVQAAMARRRREFGLLRTLGATRAQTRALILAEAALLGGIGTLLGLPLGYFVAARNIEAVSGTLTNLYLLSEIESLVLPPWMFLLAGAIGIAGAMLGAAPSALEVARRDPIGLLSALSLHERERRGGAKLFFAGVGLPVLALGWFGIWGRTWQPGGFVLAVALLLSLPLLTPQLLSWVRAAIPTRGFGLGYSLKTLTSRPATTAFAVAALAITVSMLVGITVMVGCFRKTLDVWIEHVIRADIYVSTPGSARGSNGAALDAEILAALRAHPGVVALDTLRRMTGYHGERRITLTAVDMGLSNGLHRFRLLRGDPAEAQRRAREEGAVLISEPLARKAGLREGDSLALRTATGIAALPIAGVYYDYGSETGSAAMDHAVLDHLFGPRPITNCSLYLSPDVDVESVVDQLKARFAETPLRFRSNRMLREQVMAIFDQTFAITRILQAMCLLIAVCGIALTLLVLAREQSSELALYRSLGATRRRLFGLFVGKGLGIGLLGLGLGALGGLALALILVLVINRAYFGWTIQLYWPWTAIAKQTTAILVAALLAALYPALRASQAPAQELSRDE